MRHRGIALAALMLAGCGGTGLGGYTSAPGVSFRREDRVVLTASNYVEAIAVSQRLVFSVTRNALAIYDRQFGAWQPPVDLPPELAAGRIEAVAADPMEDAVWIGTFGTVLFYRPAVDVQIAASVPGLPDLILFDLRDLASGAYVRAGGGWYLVSRVGTVTPVMQGQLPPPTAQLRQPTLQEVYARYPSLQNFQAMMTRDEQLRSWPVTAVGTAPETEQVWLGTAGNGIYHVDPRFGEAEHVPFGLLAEGAGAIDRAIDGIWVASYSGGLAGRGGLTFVRTDLQTWRWLEGGIDRPFAQTRALDLAVRGPLAWVATDRGLFRLDTRNPIGVRRWSLTNGLPDDRALCVAAIGTGVWVGTARGLSFIPGDPAASTSLAVGQTLLQGIAVRGLAASGDTIWAATDAGLLAALSSDSMPRRPTANDSRLRQPLVAVVRTDSLLLAATENEVVALSGARVLAMPALGRGQLGVGRVLAVAADSQTVWVAGDRGVAVVQRASGVNRLLPVPSAIPAPALDIVLDPDFAWIATRDGVVRLRRLPDGSVR